MKTNPASWSRGRLIAVIAAGLVLLILVGVGVYGLIAGPQRPAVPGPGSDPTVTAPGETKLGRPGPSRVVPSNDPDEFARNVAMRLFGWDTGSGLMPLDYSAAIVEVGDPSGHEQAGLASDVDGYLPSREAWIELRKYATTQHLTIESSGSDAGTGDI